MLCDSIEDRKICPNFILIYYFFSRFAPAYVMEKSFDLGSVLGKHQKKHKCKPTQFESVAGGVQKRIETSLKLRKSSRLTSFDYARNLPQASPVPEPSDAEQKADNRKKQLQKWKEEKEKKKKELAAKKVKPFITGVPHNPIKYVPPPPLKPMPSTSGRVTRSQAAKNQQAIPKTTQSQSFAPNNAGFRAPQIKTLPKIPKLELAKTKDATKFSFQPVLPSATSGTVRTRASQRIAETRAKAANGERNKPRGRIAKPVLKSNKPLVVQSSSSENESYNQTSTSGSDVDKTARILSSSENSKIYSSTEDSSKSLQSSSSCEIELVLEKSNSSKSLQSESSCEIVPEKPIGKRKSILTSKTPSKSMEHVKDKSGMNTPKNLVPRSESSSEEKLRSPKSLLDAPMTPEQIAEEFKNISPCVTMSRGKDNARKEMKKKLEEGLLDEDASDMDSIEHFQKQLASEIKRLTEICEVWDKINEQVALSESIQGMLLGAVGQARLLMSQKMQQFAQLVQRCARPEPGATLVTPADLRGFWDMLFLQVENVDMRFKELEELKARDWVEVAAPAAAARKPRVARPAARPGGPRPAARPGGGPSRLRDMIIAARKAKAQEAAEAPAPPPGERTFEAGFFCVRSPARAPAHTPATPTHTPTHTPTRTPTTPNNRQNLLKAVLSNEAEKASASKKSASFAMLRASVFGKNVECEGVAPLPQSPLAQINLNATPSRSILKQPTENKTTVKQIKAVLFEYSDSETDQNSATESLPQDNINDVSANGEISPMDMDGKEDQSNTNKDNSKKLIRQNAFTEGSPQTTKEMLKYGETFVLKETTPSEQKTPLLEKKKRTSRKSVREEKVSAQISQMEQETQHSEQETLVSERKTPKRSARKKVSAVVESIETPQIEHSEKKNSRRSLRNKVLVEIEQEMSQSEQKTPPTEKKTPKRSARKKVTAAVENTETLHSVQEIEHSGKKNKVLVEIEDMQEQEMSQSEQKTSPTEKKTPKRSARKKVTAALENTETLHSEQEIELSGKRTPRRSVRAKILVELEDMQTSQAEQEMSPSEQEMSPSEQKMLHSENKTRKRSTRNKVAEIKSIVQKENVTPARSSRRRKTKIAADIDF